MAKGIFEKYFKGKKIGNKSITGYLQALTGDLDFLSRIYSKLGLADEYFKDRPYLKLIGFDFGEIANATPKIKYFKKSNAFVSDTVHLTYILFGSRQLYIYNYAVNSDMTLKKETLVEIFYKDISSISVDENIVKFSNDKYTYGIPNAYFSLTFSNQKLFVPLPQGFDINNEDFFNARKFIRDKKFLG